MNVLRDFMDSLVENYKILNIIIILKKCRIWCLKKHNRICDYFILIYQCGLGIFKKYYGCCHAYTDALAVLSTSFNILFNSLNVLCSDNIHIYYHIFVRFITLVSTFSSLHHFKFTYLSYHR